MVSKLLCYCFKSNNNNNNKNSINENLQRRRSTSSTTRIISKPSVISRSDSCNYYNNRTKLDTRIKKPMCSSFICNEEEKKKLKCSFSFSSAKPKIKKLRSYFDDYDDEYED